MALAFVASVPGKDRQSLFFGLYGFGFVDFMEGLAGVRGIRSGCRRSVSGLFSNPPEAELFPVIFRRFPPAEPVGNTFSFVVRNFSGYFSFSRWPGGLDTRPMVKASIWGSVSKGTWRFRAGFTVTAPPRGSMV